jgi:hypothetical protein
MDNLISPIGHFAGVGSPRTVFRSPRLPTIRRETGTSSSVLVVIANPALSEMNLNCADRVTGSQSSPVLFDITFSKMSAARQASFRSRRLPGLATGMGRETQRPTQAGTSHLHKDCAGTQTGRNRLLPGTSPYPADRGRKYNRPRPYFISEIDTQTQEYMSGFGIPQPHRSRKPELDGARGPEPAGSESSSHALMRQDRMVEY